jgi:hypothetical protein
MPEVLVSAETVICTANLTGVTAAGSYVRIPEMPVKGKIASMKIKDHSSDPGAKTTEFQIVVTEPGYEGAERRINKRVIDDTSKGQNSKKGWRTALESVGYTSAQLDSGSDVKISGNAFLGKEGYFFHKPRLEGVEGSFDDMEFITPAVYEQRKRALALRGNVNTGTTATVSGPSTDLPTNGAAPQPIDTQSAKESLLL